MDEAPATARRVMEKNAELFERTDGFGNKNSVYVQTPSTSASYDPGTGLIGINDAFDLSDKRGKFFKRFHENWHLVDHQRGKGTGGYLSESKPFQDAMKNDYSIFEQSVRNDLQSKMGRAPSQPEMQDAFKEILKGDAMAGVSDCIHGMSGGKYLGSYGHFTSGYWSRKGAVEHETSSNFYSTIMLKNGPRSEEYAFIKKHFGGTLQEMIRLMRVAAK